MGKKSFKLEHPFEKRQAECARIRQFHPGRIPIIVEKAAKSDVPDIDKQRCFLQYENVALNLYKLINVVLTSYETEDGETDIPLSGKICCERFLVLGQMTVGQFVFVIRQKIKLSAEKAIFIFVNDVLPPTSSIMSALYQDHKDEDGFLYVTYSGENTFGESSV